MVLIAKGASAPIRIIENNGDGGLGNTRLSLLVDKFLKIGSPDLLQISDAQYEADRVKDVGLPRAIEPRDSVEEWVETRNHSPRRIRLETFQTYLLYVHFFAPIRTRKKKKTKSRRISLPKGEI